MAGNGGETRSGGPAPGGGWTPIPDPTELTTAAVETATSVFRRELQALRDTIETRLDAADDDRVRIWERLRDLPQLYEVFTSHLRDELIERDGHDRELVDQRMAAIDKATELLAGETARVAAIAEQDGQETRLEALALVAGLKELIEQRIGGIDKATELLASNVTGIAADIDKSAAALKAITDTRLAGMDEATRLLATNVDKVPYAILQEAGNLKALILSKIDDVSHVSDEKFAAVDALFASNALALAAALAAQEKAVAAQNDSNTLAISKSESSTKETIAANAAQAQTANSSLAAQVTDIKERVVRIESGGAGVTATRAEAREERGLQHSSTQLVIAGIAAVIAILSVIAAVAIALHK